MKNKENISIINIIKTTSEAFIESERAFKRLAKAFNPIMKEKKEFDYSKQDNRFTEYEPIKY